MRFFRPVLVLGILAVVGPLAAGCSDSTGAVISDGDSGEVADTSVPKDSSLPEDTSTPVDSSEPDTSVADSSPTDADLADTSDADLVDAADADKPDASDAGKKKGCMGIFCLLGKFCCNNMSSPNYGMCIPLDGGSC